MSRYILLLTGALLFLSYPAAAVVEVEPIEQGRLTTAEVQNVVLRNGSIYGEVINKSNVPLKDVRLLVRHIWLWNNEYRPGRDMYSQAEYLPIDGIIPPGEAVKFRYTPALPTAHDGHFKTKVIVGEFTELPAQTAQR